MSHKTFIISEIGINHNGDLNLAKKLIKKSKISGADAVKFQKRDIDLVYSKKELDKERESPFGSTNRDQKLGLEFEKKEYDEIDDFCKKLNIEWFASAWDLNSQEFLKQYNCKYNKIASAMIIDEQLLKVVAKEKKYTFISTGMSSYKEIDKAVEIFNEENCKYELMHCISQYPFDAEYASLNLISEMKKRYNCNIGYSGHEKSGLAISYGAIALGATSIERHITLDRSMYGSDQAASLSIPTFAELIGGIRSLEKALNGQKNKEILEIELPVAAKLRSHIYKK
jgi:N-acetylneuraminate synthase